MNAERCRAQFLADDTHGVLESYTEDRIRLRQVSIAQSNGLWEIAAQLSEMNRMRQLERSHMHSVAGAMQPMYQVWLTMLGFVEALPDVREAVNVHKAVQELQRHLSDLMGE